MTSIWNIIRHHFKSSLKNKLGILILIIPTLPIFLGGMLIQQGEEKNYGTINVCVYDKREQGEILIQQLKQEKVEVKTIEQEALETAIEEKREGIYVEIVTAALYEDLLNDEAVVNVTQVGERLQDTQVTQTLEYVLKRMQQQAKTSTKEQSFISSLGKEQEQRLVVRVQRQTEGDTALQLSIFGIFSMLFLLVCSKNLDTMIKEKQNNVYIRLKTTPITKPQYVIGHLVGALGIAMIQGGIVCIGIEVFKINIGLSPMDLMILCFGLAVIGITISLLVYQYMKTVDAYYIGTTFSITICSMIGGGLFPESLLPEWMRNLALLSPITWIIKAYQERLNQNNWAIFIQYVGIAVLIACVIGVIGMYKDYVSER